MDIVKNCGVYKIVNCIDGKVYIGSSVNIYSRKHNHFHCLKLGKHKNHYLQSAFNKHGENNFQFFILEYSSKDNLLKCEQKYLDIYFDNQKQCYNLKPNAENSYGYKHSKESKEKMSKARIGMKLSEKTKRKMSKNRTGKKIHSNKRKKELSVLFSGKNNPGYGKYGSSSKTSKVVYQHDLNCVFIKKWGSLIEASEELNICKTSISSCCHGRLKKAGGFIWSFKCLKNRQ